ncbi:MAG: hypothetical protein RLZZ301_1369 [Bacteroidota bacterium]|jgi:hypothetical protein
MRIILLDCPFPCVQQIKKRQDFDAILAAVRYQKSLTNPYLYLLLMPN